VKAAARKKRGPTEEIQVGLENPSKTFWSLGENGEFLLAFVLAFVLNAALRLVEYTGWQAESYWIGAEPLMATHDAYAWLAGAKGVGFYVSFLFTGMIRRLHEFTGLPLGVVGFWLPVWIIPWMALPACLLARAMRLTEGGVVFAVLSASSIGFLVRTRLGFCDTDVVSLLFPLAFACALIAWFMTRTRRTWKSGEEGVPPHRGLSSVLLLVSGACGALNMLLYSQSGSILLGVLGTAFLAGFVLAPRTDWVEIWAGLLAVYALTFGGVPGALAALVLTTVSTFRPELWKQKTVLIFLAGAALLLFVYSGLHNYLMAYLQAIAKYAKSAIEVGNKTAALQLPGITQSVREAQNLTWNEMAVRTAGDAWLFPLGAALYAFAVYRRPQLILLLPFLGLSMASVKLGNRFAMFGGVALGAGFGFGTAELMRLLGQSQGRRWIAQLGLCVLVFQPMGELMGNLSPMPVLPKVYAQTFVNLREKIEPDARLWQWWDYGYAGQYYAERLTFGDGGAQDGTRLYPLARVHCTHSPAQAGRLMRYITLSQRELSDQKSPAVYYGTNPVQGLENMGAADAMAFVNSLAFREQNFPEDLPAQYFVVSWENLRLSYWISFYGNWDLISGIGAPGQLQQLHGEFRIDTQSGQIFQQSGKVFIDSLDIIDDGDTARHMSWQNGSGLHLILNQRSNQVFLMNPKIYNSMMIQMLIGDPQDFAPHFELVEDNYPWVRAYKAI
jgi:dolichyl-diphosphooligosaccharide--protein glycosyltransferase